MNNSYWNFTIAVTTMSDAWPYLVSSISAAIAATAAWINSKTAAKNTHEIKHSVNSERESLLKRLDAMQSDIVALSRENSALREYRRITNEVPTQIKLALLDDDKLICEIVRHNLSLEKGVTFDLDCFLNVQEATSAFLAMRHDVYLVDITLDPPTYDGFQFIRSLRGQGHTGPFIILSSLISPESERRALAEGVHLVIEKSEIEAGRLGRHIRFVIQSFRAARSQEVARP